MLVKKDDFWVDEENNNRWDCEKFSQEQAEKESLTQKDCFGLRDCSDLVDCFGLRDCSDLVDCFGLRDCSYLVDVRNCSDLVDVRSCSGLRDVQKYTTPKIGSRKSQTTIYFAKDFTQVICGCFKGTLKEFIEKVGITYPKDHAHYIEYMKEITKMRDLIKC